MRPPGWILPVLIAGALAGCGGGEDNSSTEQKPALTVPGEPSEPPSADSTEATTDSTETAPPADTPSGPMDQPNPSNGGAAAPDNNHPPADQGSPPDSEGNDTPPKPGSPADRFEQFCAENPGAC